MQFGIIFFRTFAAVLINTNLKMKEYYRILAYVGGGIVLVLILFATCCTVVDSGEVGIRFHKWSLNEQDYGGVEGTCKGWVFYNDIFTKYRVGVKELEEGYIRTCIYEAYRTCANQYTSDSLMSNRANFERDVRARLEKSLMAEGFLVEEFTSKITPPSSLLSMIDAKNTAIQSALKAENEVKEAQRLTTTVPLLPRSHR